LIEGTLGSERDKNLNKTRDNVGDAKVLMSTLITRTHKRSAEQQDE